MATPDHPPMIGGLVVLPGGYDLPAVVIAHIAAGHAVLPVDAEKTPLVEWKEYQRRAPTREEILDWIRAFGERIWGWVRVTGARGGVIVVDLDGAAAAHAATWGVEPHVRTGSGGYHLILAHPGWPVRTVNSKTGKRHGEQFPGVDIRGDGGYSLIQGGADGLRYEWLRGADPDPLDVLPEPMRRFFGLWEAPTEPVDVEGAERPTLTRPDFRGTDTNVPSVEHLVERAVVEASVAGRNNGGYWLAQQLWDNGYEQAEMLAAGELYVAACPDTNMKGEPEPYTLEHYRKSMRQVMSLPRREPWREEEIVAHFGPSLTLPGVDEPAETPADGGDAAPDEEATETAPEPPYTAYRGEIDKLLVPTELGVERPYDPWAIENFLRVGNRGIIFGMAGAAKSYALVDLARAAVTHTTWLARTVLPGSVLYVAGEDALGIHHRVEAAIRHFGVARKHQVRVLESAVAITHHETVKKLIDLFDYLPEKPAYVILDNLSLCFGSLSPNDAEGAKLFVDGCQMIQDYRWRAASRDPDVRKTDQRPITVIVVHHANKAGNFNGSQYFINLVDAMSELSWDGKEPTRTLWAIKQRHGKQHAPLSFHLHEVDPTDELCVIVPKITHSAITEAEIARRKLDAKEVAILDCLRWADQEWCLARAQELHAAEGLLRGEITLRSKVPAGSMSRVLSRLVTGGLVEVVPVEVERGERKPPNRYRLTAAGHEVIRESEESRIESFAKTDRGSDRR